VVVSLGVVSVLICRDDCVEVVGEVGGAVVSVVVVSVVVVAEVVVSVVVVSVVTVVVV
jgi:hypothetical protein